MKKIIFSTIATSLLILCFPSQASMSYECWAYVGGSPSKMVHVSANNSSEAKKLAKKKMDKLKIKYNSVKCK